VLLVHSLEMTQDAAALLREAWRVLASAAGCWPWCRTGAACGRAWTRRRFGHGRPYSRSQITSLLRETWFTPTGWGEALYVPPIARGWFLRTAVAWSAPARLYRAICRRAYRGSDQAGLPRDPGAARKRRLVPALEPALAPSPGA